MPTLQSVLSDALWILGLSGLLATGSYMQWHRVVHGRTWRYVLHTPRLLLPFCLSATFFCAGVALSGRLATDPAAWWETVVWVIMVVFFTIHSVLYGVAGDKYGWDTSTEGKQLL